MAILDALINLFLGAVLLVVVCILLSAILETAKHWWTLASNRRLRLRAHADIVRRDWDKWHAENDRRDAARLSSHPDKAKRVRVYIGGKEVGE